MTRFRYVLLGIVIIVFLFSAAFSVLRLQDKYRVAASDYKDVLFAASHIDAELSSILRVLDNYANSTDGLKQQEFRETISRSKGRLLKWVDRLADTAQAGPNAQQLAGVIRTEFQRISPQLDVLRPGQLREYIQVRNSLSALVRPLKQIVGANELREYEDFLEQEKDFAPVYLELLLYALGTFGAGGLLVTILVREIRRTTRLYQEKSEAEARETAARTRLSEAIETMTDAFAIYDADDRLVVHNSKFADLYQAEAVGTLQGETFEKVLRNAVDQGRFDGDGKDEEWIRWRLNRHANPGDSFELSADDDQWFLVGEYRTHEGGIVGVHTDISRLKEYEGQLEEAKNAAEEANVAKSRFLAMMSHEIRTPMNGVLGMANLLMETPLDGEQNQYARTVIQSGEALMTIINDILDFSKLEADRLELERVPFDLTELVEGTVELLSPRAFDSGIEIVGRIGDEMPVRIMSDPTRIRQVLLNFAGNAVKFTEEGGVTLRVDLVEHVPADLSQYTDEQTGTIPDHLTKIRFSVVDTGIGIPEDRQQALFQEFTQVDASIARKYGGTGLGLAISRRLVDMMGGQIGFHSKPGEGSTFWFEIAVPALGQVTAATLARDTELAGQSVAVYMRNDIARAGMTHLLRQMGMKIAASSGELEMPPARLPYIIADAALVERMDAVELQDILRQVAMRSIVLVEPSNRSSVEKFLGMGFDGFLVKPAPRTALRSALQGMQLTEGGDAFDIEMANTSLTSGRVLVTDDNKINLQVANIMLQKAGHRVTTAESGEEALELIQAQDFDVILLDVHMPNMDGFQVVDQIRALSGGKADIPVVAVTANAMQEHREICLEKGMDDFLPKPFERTELLLLVNRWVEYQHRKHNARPSGADAVGQGRLIAVNEDTAEAQKLLQSVSEGLDGASDNPVAEQADDQTPDTEGSSDTPSGRGEIDMTVLDMPSLNQFREDVGEEVLPDIVVDFIEDSRARIQRIIDGCQDADCGELHREAHSIKSSAGTLGIRSLSEIAQLMENAYESQNREQALSMIDDLVSVSENAFGALEIYVKQASEEDAA